jgi:predicted XRE-type DNA-binding protein
MTSRQYASVFDAIADTPQEAACLRLRAEVMRRIADRIARKGWTQREAAEHAGITPAAHQRSGAGSLVQILVIETCVID